MSRGGSFEMRLQDACHLCVSMHTCRWNRLITLDWMQPIISVVLKAPLTDDAWIQNNGVVKILGPGIHMDVFGPSRCSGYTQEPFLVFVEPISLAPFVKILNVMSGRRTLVQRKLRSSKRAAAVGVPGGLWEIVYDGNAIIYVLAAT